MLFFYGMYHNLNKFRNKNIFIGSLSLVGSTSVTVAVGFVMAGVLARYFSPEEFGLWTILMSLNGILISGFDFGFGNALRNKLAEFYGKGGIFFQKGQVYFFAIFYWFIFNAIIIGLFFALARHFLPWGVLFHTTDPYLIDVGSILFTIGGAILAFNLAFNIYTSGFFGYQESHWNALANSLSKTGLLIFSIISILLKFSFFSINILLFSINIISSIIAFLTFLRVRRWRWQWISIGDIWIKVKELWKPSVQFAALQIFSVILLNADYFIVSKLSGLEIVGDYFLVKRIYLVLASFHFALILPIWSAYTEAIEKQDFEWVIQTLRKSATYTLFIFISGIIGMLFLGEWIIYIWTAKRVHSPSLFIWLGIWGLIYGWNNCFSVFLNGAGHLKRQVIFVGLAAGLFIPLGHLGGKIYGVIGICYTLVLVAIPVAISNPLESFRLINYCRKIKNN